MKMGPCKNDQFMAVCIATIAILEGQKEQDRCWNAEQPSAALDL